MYDWGLDDTADRAPWRVPIPDGAFRDVAARAAFADYAAFPLPSDLPDLYDALFEGWGMAHEGRFAGGTVRLYRHDPSDVWAGVFWRDENTYNEPADPEGQFPPFEFPQWSSQEQDDRLAAMLRSIKGMITGKGAVNFGDAVLASARHPYAWMYPYALVDAILTSSLDAFDGFRLMAGMDAFNDVLNRVEAAACGHQMAGMSAEMQDILDPMFPACSGHHPIEDSHSVGYDHCDCDLCAYVMQVRVAAEGWLADLPHADLWDTAADGPTLEFFELAREWATMRSTHWDMTDTHRHEVAMSSLCHAATDPQVTSLAQALALCAPGWRLAAAMDPPGLTETFDRPFAHEHGVVLSDLDVSGPIPTARVRALGWVHAGNETMGALQWCAAALDPEPDQVWMDQQAGERFTRLRTIFDSFTSFKSPARVREVLREDFFDYGPLYGTPGAGLLERFVARLVAAEQDGNGRVHRQAG